jgi:hypothetical protein
MIALIAKRIVNGNEVQLIIDSGTYYIKWGEAAKEGKTRTKLTTPKGRKPSLNQVYNQFLEACEAAEYIKFSKL